MDGWSTKINQGADQSLQKEWENHICTRHKPVLKKWKEYQMELIKQYFQRRWKSYQAKLLKSNSSPPKCSTTIWKNQVWYQKMNKEINGWNRVKVQLKVSKMYLKHLIHNIQIHILVWAIIITSSHLNQRYQDSVLSIKMIVKRKKKITPKLISISVQSHYLRHLICRRKKNRWFYRHLGFITTIDEAVESFRKHLPISDGK